MSKLKVTTIANVADSESTDVTNVINGSAKAWVNFDGTGTPSIRQAFNVSSITDNGTGDFTANFTTAFSDADYSSVVTDNWYGMAYTVSNPSASGLRVFSRTDSGGLNDSGRICIAIFR